ncbi:MAG TPA: asparagine synthase-related protein, partial [Gemmatimonadaceae bacterium]|nr:asparagine synthase-related protein [Gemmatimonadaceae bacterium]
MRFFVCLVNTDVRSPSDITRRAYEALPRTRGLACEWQRGTHAAVLTAGDDTYGSPLAALYGDHLAVGMVRLDNREELETWAVGARDTNLTDLELVLYTVARHGTKYIPAILGDFAFVVWNGTTHTAIAASDALEVRKLYYSYSTQHGAIAFSSRAEALALDERYDVRYLAESVAKCTPSPELTVYAGVRKLPGGHMAMVERGALTTRRYWSVDDFEMEPFRVAAEREAPIILRQLLATSVRLRLGDNGDTWAHLSGGLDSSSVVSMAQWLADSGITSHGLAGTVTFVDSRDTDADEREYSDTVVQQWRVLNETVVEAPIWFDEHGSPPRYDQP